MRFRTPIPFLQYLAMAAFAALLIPSNSIGEDKRPATASLELTGKMTLKAGEQIVILKLSEPRRLAIRANVSGGRVALHLITVDETGNWKSQVIQSDQDGDFPLTAFAIAEISWAAAGANCVVEYSVKSE